jgi:DMSO/TMAO reductase YedYZ molybdopterin-dependent catalytic subunit
MRKTIFITLFIFVLLLSACQPASTPEVEAPVDELVVEEPTEVIEEPTAVPEPPATPEPIEEVSQEPVLELIGPDTTLTFTMADLKALPAREGMAGIKSSTGKITLPINLKVLLLKIWQVWWGI